MYRLLAVEDEEILRKAIPKLIDWEKLRITVAGLVEGGDQALDFLKKHPVDIVMSDIRMSGMSGLDLAQHIDREYSNIKVVLLSAYGEFTYAQRAIEHGVVGYLLKSSDDHEIVEYFSNLIEMLDEERGRVSFSAGDDVEASNHFVQEAIRYIRARYFEEITLETVARHVNIHPVYLSRLIKEDTSLTFKQILTYTRIEMSKRMLDDAHKRVYEISELVGYRTPRYFSEVFKEQTGMTPNEYREKRHVYTP